LVIISSPWFDLRNIGLVLLTVSAPLVAGYPARVIVIVGLAISILPPVIRAEAVGKLKGSRPGISPKPLN